MIIFGWHAYRGGLNARGGATAPARGVEAMKLAKMTHVGVPMHHLGQNGDWNYITNLTDNGFQIVRTVELNCNAGVEAGYDGGNINLGKVLLEWHGTQDPGPFFERFTRTLQAPCNGIGWNLEHDILNANRYPLTDEDFELANEWGLSKRSVVSRKHYAKFRCEQFAILFKIYLAQAELKMGMKMLGIGYSGYNGLDHNTTTVQNAYGCDWDMQHKEAYFCGKVLHGIDYAMCSHHMLKLKKAAFTKRPKMPILHNIGLVHMDDPVQRKRAHRRAIADRIRKMEPGDGLGTVAVEGGAWSDDDDYVCECIDLWNSLKAARVFK